MAEIKQSSEAPLPLDAKCPICRNEPLGASLQCCKQPVGSKCFFKLVVHKKDQTRPVCPLCRQDPVAAAKADGAGQTSSTADAHREAGVSDTMYAMPLPSERHRYHF